MSRYSVEDLVAEAGELAGLGVKALLLFGVPEEKDDEGSGAWDEDGIVQRALRALRAEHPELVLVTDVCLCEYTAHGHCGVIRDGEVANDETLELLARTAVSHVEAGADAVAPSDMMDGRVGAIREALPETPIVAYAAKYASAFYGPFRDVAESTPSFGDRRGYQMDPANVREALRECELDLAEGADVLMVKPALPYLDVIRAVRERFDCPVAAYNVSGEYAMVKAAAAAGHLDERAGGARVADRDQARRRRPRLLLLDEGPRVVALRQRSDLARRAEKLIPGGVNSPVRAMRSVGLDEPIFIRSGSGSTIEDVDGNRYVDWVLTWGPLLFGHADAETLAAIAEAAQRGTTFGAPTEGEVELAAEIVDAVPSVEMVRLVSSGTEAAMSAIRLARGFTRRDRIIKFAGCYHGHADALLASAGSGLATLGIPSSPGVPDRARRPTRSSRTYNDLDAAAAAVERYGEGLAAIIVEPVAGNMGVVPPAPGLPRGAARALRRLRRAAVFDEVITGFRVARGGAQERYGVLPDLTILGKIVGGGLPAAAFGGRADVMERLAPAGDVYQAGTLSGNPLATAAGIIGAAPAARRRRLRASSRRRAPGSRRASPRSAASSASARWRRSSSATAPCATSRTRRRATPSATARSSATCSSAGSTSRRRSSSACSSRSRTRTRTSTARSRPLATSSATDVFETIAAEAAAESPLWGEALRADPERVPVFGALVPERFALGSRRSTRATSSTTAGRACSRRRTRTSRCCSATTSTRTASSGSPRPGDARRGRRARRADLDVRRTSAPRASPATATPGSAASAGSAAIPTRRAVARALGAHADRVG